MTDSAAPPGPDAPETPDCDLADAERDDDRWEFLRDVAVFQAKMALDNLRDFALMPASLIAAGIDVLFKGEREGHRFYEVLRWGRRSEELINVYGAICKSPRAEDHADDPEWADSDIRRNYSVDAVVAQLEAAVKREYSKGGPAANLKDAVDGAIDELRAKAGHGHRTARSAMDGLGEHLRKGAGGRRNGARSWGDGYRWDGGDADARRDGPERGPGGPAE